MKRTKLAMYYGDAASAQEGMRTCAEKGWLWAIEEDGPDVIYVMDYADRSKEERRAHLEKTRKVFLAARYVLVNMELIGEKLTYNVVEL